MNIKIARIKKGYKQYELAQMLGISREALRKIENGETKLPKKELIKKISFILDVSIEELFFEE